MTMSIDTTHPGFLIAIDIAKARHDVLVKHPSGRRQSFRVANSGEDFDRFCAFLKSLGGPCRIAVEPTADYHRPLAWRLIQEGHEVCLASSMACARAREPMFNSRDKKDPKDTRVILHLLETGIVQHYHDPMVHGIHDLQDLANTYSVIVHRRAQLLHNLKNHYFTLYFPEIEKYLNSSRSEWFVRTLHRFPTSASIRALTPEGLITEACPWWDENSINSKGLWNSTRRPPRVLAYP